MAKIRKGFSITITILGVLCLIWGICISVISWVLAAKTPRFIYEKDMNSNTIPSTRSYYIYTYWWGGLGFIIPGVLGAVTGVTRNVAVMAFFLISDILRLLASLGMSILVAIAIAFWGPVSQYLEGKNGNCIDPPPPVPYDIEKKCVCFSAKKLWTIYDVTCEDVRDIQSMLVALVALGALATLMSSIASFISCFSLCNQEQDDHGAVITQQPRYCAPPSMVVAHTSNYQQAASYQHPPQRYPPQQYPPQQSPSHQNPPTQQVPPPYAATPEQQYPVSHDKARLLMNEET